jgi:hypothetical protein
MIHKFFFIPNDFSLHFKTTMTIIINQVLKGRQMQMMVYVDILILALVHYVQTSLHVWS